MFHRKSEAGKGDVPRRVDQRKYARGYLRAFGKPCPVCNLAGKADPVCKHCDGIGFVE